MPPSLQKEIEKELNELWNEHDGTHFYKDEFQSFLSSALTRAYEAGQEAERERVWQECEKMKKNTIGPSSVFHEMALGALKDRGFDEALSAIQEIIKSNTSAQCSSCHTTKNLKYDALCSECYRNI